MNTVQIPLKNELTDPSTSGGMNSLTCGTSRSNQLNILSLNEDVLQEILARLNFDEVARLRQVSKQFNEICQKILNKGFLSVQRYHSRCLKEVKAKVPRRESERRAHPLARHIDVLMGIETRLSLLSMTFYKYIVLGLFCFIPGKVLDECYRVLREVVVHKNLPKSYELLQELRDISSMAMEHFEEHIVPTVKKQTLSSSLRSSPRFLRCLHDNEEDNEQPSSSGTLPFSHQASTTPVKGVVFNYSSPEKQCANIKLEFTVQQNRMLISSQQKKIQDLNSKLVEYGRKINEQECLLSEYGRKIVQLEQKLSHGNCVCKTREDSSPPGNSANRKRPRSRDLPENSDGPREFPKKRTHTADDKTVKTFSMSLRSHKNE